MTDANFKNFDIGEEILKALEKLKYNKPSEVQKQVIPLALQGKDIIVKSQTGSGKTGAFAIPICEKVEIEESKLQALVLTPTRELAIQVKEDIKNIGRFKRVRSAAIFGKQPFSDQVRELKQRVHVVVGTPGRTLDHLKRGTVDIGDIKYLIIDEADEMLNMGFIEQVEGIINYLPKDRVTMLFSATIPEEIEKLCYKYMSNPENIEINSNNLTVEKIKQIYYEVESNKKFSFLKNIIYTERPDSCIIFCNLKDTVESLTQRLKSRGYSCSKLHGGMLQKDRIDMMESFKRGEFRFLVATDVAARGIDVENVTHVINYDIPMEKESYVHRIGRTGRAGKEGIAITLVSSKEYRFLREIEEYIGLNIEEGKLPSEEEIEKGREIFEEIIKVKHVFKNIKSVDLDKEIMKIHINAGKKKKIRAGDIVGAITNIKGVNAENIGVIDIQDNFSYVDILDGKGNLVINELQQTTIKGKSVRVQKAVK
ncbi:DEAD/DEAH box helicase [Clostridium sp. PL3]|uniref:ATP-dependent RNA helicase DbpA n=1 Tax=Clostridium thailandense TaxID=2794346 RepID=A0A949X4K4_9CLOT|nr:DEAD/DEAH box helicase [Clostridium thailandense]MBV7274143.1 DEAD/DEAH box helicase [Clostridium thailandense]